MESKVRNGAVALFMWHRTEKRGDPSWVLSCVCLPVAHLSLNACIYFMSPLPPKCSTLSLIQHCFVIWWYVEVLEFTFKINNKMSYNDYLLISCWLFFSCKTNCIDFLLSSPQKWLTPKMSGDFFFKVQVNPCLAILTANVPHGNFTAI